LRAWQIIRSEFLFQIKDRESNSPDHIKPISSLQKELVWWKQKTLPNPWCCRSPI